MLCRVLEPRATGDEGTKVQINPLSYVRPLIAIA